MVHTTRTMSNDICIGASKCAEPLSNDTCGTRDFGKKQIEMSECHHHTNTGHHRTRTATTLDDSDAACSSDNGDAGATGGGVLRGNEGFCFAFNVILMVRFHNACPTSAAPTQMCDAITAFDPYNIEPSNPNAHWHSLTVAPVCVRTMNTSSETVSESLTDSDRYWHATERLQTNPSKSLCDSDWHWRASETRK